MEPLKTYHNLLDVLRALTAHKLALLANLNRRFLKEY